MFTIFRADHPAGTGPAVPGDKHMTTMIPMLERIQSILPQIAERAAQAEQTRTVPAENIALLKHTGLHRAFQPKAYGGLELSLPEFAQCVVALAGACAGTTWAFSLLCTH